VHPHATVSPWTIAAVRRVRGGPVVVPRQHAPLARALPYRRAAGELPSYTSGADVIGRLGWSVILGNRGLGDVLLALGLVQALADGTGHTSELHYQGPRRGSWNVAVAPSPGASTTGRTPSTQDIPAA
jgi:hypothetical protein